MDAPVDAMDTEPPAFESFFEEQKERLLRTLSVITGSRAEAEDLAQEAFTRVFERWERVAAMEDPAGYLHRTAMNLFRNQYRRTKVALGRAVGIGPEQDVFKSVDDRAEQLELVADRRLPHPNQQGEIADAQLLREAEGVQDPRAVRIGISKTRCPRRREGRRASS